MVTAILSRIGFGILSLFALLVLVFLMIRLTGDPLQMILPETASPADFAAARQALGLDQPLPVQFEIYLGQVVRGDLGRSIRGGVLNQEDQLLNPSVSGLISQRLPATVALGTVALLLTLAVGIPLGIYSAYQRGGVLDRFARAVASLGQAVPSFWLGLLLVLVFAVQLHVLPDGGSGPASFVLPAMALAFTPIAGLTRLLRSSMIETLNSDYITFLRMKGVPESEILWKHALRNAGLTTLTFVGLLTAGLFTGSVLVETVFVWPGIGRLMYEAVTYSDFPLAQGIMLVFGTMYIGVNLIVDLLYMVLNPRLRTA